MATEVPPTPYISGGSLSLQLDAKRSANVLIVGNFEPFTLSCVTLVQLNEPGLEGLFVLKLYDRRFAIQMRKEAEAPPWCSGIESGYRQFVNAGGVSNFFDSCTRKIREDEYWTHDYRENQDNSECEAYMQWLCHRIYDTEMKAYDKLRDIQGKHVPKLVARPLLKNSSNSSWSDIYLDCPRLLLEYIKGFPLTDLADFAPQDRWQSVCEEAIHIIHQIGDRGILNKDVNTRSFIVQIDPVSQKLRALEEEAIGHVMETKLKGRLKYTLSARARSLSYEFMREDAEESEGSEE